MACPLQWAAIITRSTGTVHTSYHCRDTYSDSDPDRHQNLVICSLAHCQPSLKISCKSVRKFWRKVANRQTDTQTNDDDYISSLAEVIIIVVVVVIIKQNCLLLFLIISTVIYLMT